MTMMFLESVTKAFGKVIALNSVSLKLKKGSTTAIIGKSGCGKSTLLRCLNGLVKPDEGTVYIDQKPMDYKNLTILRRTMGYAVQGIGLFPHLTVKENILLICSTSTLSKKDVSDQPSLSDQDFKDRMNYLMDFVHLDGALLDRYPHELSGGQKQRVGLCRALIMNPPILLLDEAFGAVDPITRLDIHEQFKAMLKKESRTTILVTHDIHEVVTLADDVVIMQQGQIAEAFPKTELLSSKASPYDELLQKLRINTSTIQTKP